MLPMARNSARQGEEAALIAMASGSMDGRLDIYGYEIHMQCSLLVSGYIYERM